MSGITRMPTPIPAAAIEKAVASLKMRCTTWGEMKARAKKPRTTDGMPARISRVGLSHLRARCEAYSERYTAAPRPSGTATTIATALTRMLPVTIVLMSYWPRRGNQPSLQSEDSSTWDTKVQVCPSSDRMIAALIATEVRAAAKSRILTSFSVRVRRRSPRRSASDIRGCATGSITQLLVCATASARASRQAPCPTTPRTPRRPPNRPPRPGSGPRSGPVNRSLRQRTCSRR